MADSPLAPFKGFADPLALVDRTDLDYEARLAMLQEWQAELARADAPEAQREALIGAIHALEMGAAVQSDAPKEAPEGRGCGVHKTE